jgi:hypothetical protein
MDSLLSCLSLFWKDGLSSRPEYCVLFLPSINKVHLIPVDALCFCEEYSVSFLSCFPFEIQNVEFQDIAVLRGLRAS